MKLSEKLKKVAIIGRYPPIQCGIATFTADLSEAMKHAAPTLSQTIISTGHENGSRCSKQLKIKCLDDDISSYLSLANYINTNHFDVVNIQHEYGIYSGPNGSLLLSFLRKLNPPKVITFHTVLRYPNLLQSLITKEIATLSDSIIVPSRTGLNFLTKLYQIQRHKIHVIPHGVPDLPFNNANECKVFIGHSNRLILMTYGLLSRNKGIEKVLLGLPKIKERFPNVLYIVLGKTHPNILKNEGEAYRESLKRIVHKNNIGDSVLFVDEYVSSEILYKYIRAADIYISPHCNREQLVSGTLCCALSAGKCIVSTNYWYSEELLQNGVGCLVPNDNPEAISKAVVDILCNEEKRKKYGKRAYALGREMLWHNVAKQYISHLDFIANNGSKDDVGVHSANVVLHEYPNVPYVKLSHFFVLNDDVGIVQHATHCIPNYREGYSTDDITRALIAAIYLQELGYIDGAKAHILVTKYLSFLFYSFNPETNRIRNFFSYDRRWIEEVGSESCQGRTIWSLGELIGSDNFQYISNTALEFLYKLIPSTLEFEHPRAWAFAIIGVLKALSKCPDDVYLKKTIKLLSNKLLDIYNKNYRSDWRWFENKLTYFNAKLSHALLLAGSYFCKDNMSHIAIESLEWLVDQYCSDDGFFLPIGNRGFFPKDGKRAIFDQQPIESHSIISASLDAFKITGNRKWLLETYRAFNWFLGDNIIGLPLYDSGTGGCRDGLCADGVNHNQGAESTLAYLLSACEILKLKA